MNNAIQDSSRLRIQRYLVDFLASVYLRHALTGLLGIMVLLLAWSLLPLRHNIGAVIQSAPPPMFVPDPEIVAQRVATAHLFGLTAVTRAPALAQAAVQVGGIIYSDDKNSALAILDVDGDSKVFRLGDTLPDGEKLLGIAPNAVELDGQGSRRVIELRQGTEDRRSRIAANGMVLSDDQAVSGSMPYLVPVQLSPGTGPLSQLLSLRQQLIHQKPPTPRTQPAKSKPIRP